MTRYKVTDHGIEALYSGKGTFYYESMSLAIQKVWQSYGRAVKFSMGNETIPVTKNGVLIATITAVEETL